jgi:Sap, sulfolipid-1-addressing protein
LILVIFSRRRIPNSIAFVVTLIVLTAAALALGAAGQQAGEASGGGTSTGVAIVLAGLGVLLLLVGVTNWRNRADTSEPKAFQAISGMGPAAAAFLAFGAVFVNPKNLVLLLAAGQTIGAADSGSKVLIGAVFVVLATAPYTLAAGYALLGGERANANLDRARAWLVAHNRLIMGVICTLLGLLLVVKGPTAL